MIKGKQVALDWVDEHEKTLVDVHKRIWAVSYTHLTLPTN